MIEAVVGGYPKVWESIIDYYFMLDVLVNFRTGYMWEEKDGTRQVAYIVMAYIAMAYVVMAYVVRPI